MTVRGAPFTDVACTISAGLRMHSSLMSNYAARVEELAANSVKANSQKASGPLAKAIMPMLMPIALRTFFNRGKMFGAQHSYRIDWNASAVVRSC